jgi:hypothetical protein
VTTTPHGDVAAADRILEFLRSIGLPIIETDLREVTLLPGVAIVSGTLAVDRSRLTWPGDLLHEAGHMAVTPAAQRPSLDGTLTGADEIAHAGEVEATAWAYAATISIGLDPHVLFHAGGYYGKSERLAFTYAAGCYPGVAGLVACGMTMAGVEASAHGVKPYPHMIRWLRA